MLPFSHFRIVVDSSSCNITSEENTKNHIDRMEDTQKLNAIMKLDKNNFFILINASKALLRLWHKSFFVKILYRIQGIWLCWLNAHLWVFDLTILNISKSFCKYNFQCTTYKQHVISVYSDVDVEYKLNCLFINH